MLAFFVLYYQRTLVVQTLAKMYKRTRVEKLYLVLMIVCIFKVVRFKPPLKMHDGLAVRVEGAEDRRDSDGKSRRPSSRTSGIIVQIP
jgi:hypothetical protein